MKSGKKHKHNMSDNRQTEEPDNINIEDGASRNVPESEGQGNGQEAGEQSGPDAGNSGNDADNVTGQPENSLEQEITGLQEQIASMQDKYLRLVAEFDNFRKRTVKEKAEIIKNGSADVITDILPVIDDMERAVANSSESGDFAAMKEGIELIYNKLMHILEQKGLQKISPKNEPFDTDFHEAIALIPSPDEKSKGMVVDCAIDGYRLNDKVLRHAKVAVAQ